MHQSRCRMWQPLWTGPDDVSGFSATSVDIGSDFTLLTALSFNVRETTGTLSAYTQPSTPDAVCHAQYRLSKIYYHMLKK